MTKKQAKAKKPRINWRARALVLTEELNTARSAVWDIARERNLRAEREVDAMKVRNFGLQSQNSPWIRQNDQIRQLLLTVKAKGSPTIVKKIAAILDFELPA